DKIKGMKTSQKVMIISLTIVLLLLSLSARFLPQSDSQAEAVQSTITHSPAPMKQYADSDFGFSFWYPGDWQVSSLATSSDYSGDLQSGEVLTTLAVGQRDEKGRTEPQILIQEVQSPAHTITDRLAGSSFTYFFDPSHHVWMTVNGDGYVTPFATTTA